MAKIQLPIANGFYVSDSLPLAAQECVNWYPNIVQGEGLSKETLFGTPGSTQLTPPHGTREVNRGARVLAKVPYFVNGNVLYRVERTTTGNLDTFTDVALGNIEGEGRVSMADNGRQLMILVPGGKGYIFTANPDVLNEIVDLDFRANGNPQHTVFVDGYFAITTDTKKFIVSSLNDGMSYNALDFGTAEADPDDIVAPMVLNNQLFVGGTETLEAFQNIGGDEFPFQRTGLFIQKGITAPFTAVNASTTFMFIGAGHNESPAIWELVGNSVQKVSTTAIDSILQNVSDEDMSQAFAWSYAQKGAYFVGFALPDTTMVYDLITQRWHERKSQVEGHVVRSRINSVVAAYGRVLVGDSQDGRVGALSPEILTEYDRSIIRRAATQPFLNNMEAFLVPGLELTMEAGVGNDEVPDPQVWLDRSLDGKTWSDPRARPIGRVGEYGRRTIWRRNGRAPRFEIFRFTLSDAVKPVIIALWGDIVSG